MEQSSPSRGPVPHASTPEFDQYAAEYSAGMENRLKRLAGADAEIFIELKAWHLAEDVRGRPLSLGGATPRLLDFGCGDVVLLRILAASRFPAQLHGSDVSPSMLDSAHARWGAFTAGRPSPPLQEPSSSASRPGRLPFDSGSFDIVTCLGVIHHIPPAERDREWAEIARVLRPGGR